MTSERSLALFRSYNMVASMVIDSSYDKFSNDASFNAFHIF